MDITQIYNSFAAEWSGKRYGDTTLIAEGVPASEIYQCVSLIKIFLGQDFGIAAGAWGNATAYWHLTPSPILGKFQKVGTTTTQIGDIVVLSIDHIGIANGVQTDTTFQQLDQNGGAHPDGTGTGANAIQVHTFKKSEILGVLRPIGATVGPAYTISVSPMSGQFTVAPGHNLWNLDQPTFAAIEASPVASAPSGPITIVAQLKRSDLPQYVYYLPDGNVHHGYNSLDCSPYVPPAPTIASASAAPAPIPGDTTPYSVIKAVPGYMTSNAAANHLGTAPVVVQQGRYFVFNRRYDANNKLIAINVTKVIGQSYAWINPDDNQEAPTPPAPVAPIAPAIQQVVAKAAATLAKTTNPVIPAANVTDDTWKKTLTPLLTTRKAVLFQILKPQFVHDMNNLTDPGVEFKQSDPNDKETWLPIKFWFTRSGLNYLVPFMAKDLDSNGDPLPTAHWYSIPTTDIDTGLPSLESELYHGEAESEREYRKDQGRSTTSDDLFYASQKIAKLVTDGVRFLDGIIPIKVSLKKKN
jgi:hypothetical protein